MKILLVEPFYSGSHKSWCDGLMHHSRHEIKLLSLPGKYWKWRMRGGAIELAKQFKELKFTPHLIVVSDMLDLSLFSALLKRETADIPVYIYFHENQFSYPTSTHNKKIHNENINHLKFTNFTSTLNADKILFNSSYNLTSFYDGLAELLKSYPDYNQLDAIASLKEKSAVMPLGLDLSNLNIGKKSDLYNYDEPLILWNHRWEYDKNPSYFFHTLIKLQEDGINFKLAVLGEEPDILPQIFSRAKDILKDKIVKWGYANNRDEYASWLWAADIIPVTSHHDFFGISVVEAIYCNTIPLLPKRLVYPNLFHEDQFSQFYYDDHQFKEQLQEMIINYKTIDISKLSETVKQYDWEKMIEQYDDLFEI